MHKKPIEWSNNKVLYGSTVTYIHVRVQLCVGSGWLIVWAVNTMVAHVNKPPFYKRECSHAKHSKEQYQTYDPIRICKNM